VVRPERFERPTYWFVASCSIHLSYGRISMVRKKRRLACRAFQLFATSSRIEDCREKGNPARGRRVEARGRLVEVVRPERFELPTLWFEAKCSIQLSYGRVVKA